MALTALKSICVIHGDIKPDNIMLVNQVQQLSRVKLIDFGLATPACQVKRGCIMQALAYRCDSLHSVSLNAATKSSNFFSRDPDIWRLKTPSKYYELTGIQSIETRTCIFHSLDELRELYQVTEEQREHEDTGHDDMWCLLKIVDRTERKERWVTEWLKTKVPSWIHT